MELGVVGKPKSVWSSGGVYQGLSACARRRSSSGVWELAVYA